MDLHLIKSRLKVPTVTIKGVPGIVYTLLYENPQIGLHRDYKEKLNFMHTLPSLSGLLSVVAPPVTNVFSGEAGAPV